VIGCRVVFAKLSDRPPPLRLGAQALALWAAGLTVTSVVRKAPGFVAGAAILAVGAAFLTPAFYRAIISRVEPAQRGGAAGTFSEDRGGGRDYGGVAGAAYDPCYHQPCDSLDPVADGADTELYAQLDAAYDLSGNINLEAQEEMADAAAHTTLLFAMTTSAVGGTRQASSQAAEKASFQGHRLQR